MRDMARQMMRIIKRNQPAIAIELELRRTRETIQLRNSNGGEAEHSSTWLEGEIWWSATSATTCWWRWTAATAQLDESHLDFARRMARRLRWAEKPIEPVPDRSA
ncbi:MAG: hypothetical protein U0559_11380 [Anaerolineae bacterium]